MRVRVGPYPYPYPYPSPTVPTPTPDPNPNPDPNQGPMATLRGYRARAGRGVLFGAYASVLTPGATIRAGSPVQAQYC